MAVRGVGFFDTKGHYFKSADEATMSDLAALLGRVGDGEGLGKGIAKTLLERREDIERIFAEHDAMSGKKPNRHNGPVLVSNAGQAVAG